MQSGSHDAAVTPPDEHPGGGSSQAHDGPSADDLTPLDARVRTVWRVAGLIVVAPIALIAGLIDAFARLPLPRGVLTLAVVGVLGLVALGLPALQYRRWRYAVRDDDLWIRRGVIWVTVSVIPFSRLQFVDTRTGPLDRLFGLSQLVVHTAALGTSGRLPGLDTEEAERLRERLAAVKPSDDASV